MFKKRTKLEKLVIIGNGEIAFMADQYFSIDSEYEVVAFSIGQQFIDRNTIDGRPVVPLEQLEQKYPASEVSVFVAVGDTQLNRVRAGLFAEMKQRGYKVASYVSSRAFVWPNVTIGANCFILEDNTLQPFVSIGDNVTLWSGNHIGHRSSIEDHVFVSSHVVISGFVNIGRYTFIGVNASVGNGVTIAADNYISMCACLTQSTEPNTIYQGSPAEPRKISAKRFCRVKE